MPGGVGVTTLALNIGVALAQREHQVASPSCTAGARCATCPTCPTLPIFAIRWPRSPVAWPNAVLERVIRHSSGLTCCCLGGALRESLTPEHARALLAPLRRERFASRPAGR